MIKKENFKELLEKLKFIKSKNIYSKKFKELNTELKVDFDKQELIYPVKDGLKVNDKTTSNFSSNENFVVFECVDRLLSQGYHPKHIELEKTWQLGHTGKSGKADIFITDNAGESLLIIECKTAGLEYKKAIDILENDARNQLFSYLQQATSTKFLALYASDFVDNEARADYYLINVQDNEKLLENSPELKSFKDATTYEAKYAVWRDTYKKDYATIGLFEDNKAYDIGKSKYSLKDLKTVSSKDIQGKYHEFATIMRQHNVSGRENAFDKLVNLFLCKVVDESNNADELKFYWKGVAYDDPFSLQDRLNHLYKVGMKKFLGEDITYIENAQIDDAFSVFKDKPNMTKEIIQGFFKELKFFTNNDFAFVDVHNEELFYQNFEVLLKIVKMLQDIKLTGSEDNQFLGDMFEGFLDQGVKQSEGQFFTPMPIVKFIINSLPLDEIQKNQDNPKAIDYACGAGHFLNEIANNFNKKFHKNIVGIEKEYRLSKVAKVSSFMYGQDDIQIIYHDALSKQDEVKDSDYSILVANPPYSVKGFLETLSEKERNEYELINAIEEKSFSANNAIECFFTERAKQLLRKDGVAGIILPSSILSKGSQKVGSSKGNIYVKTREIILKYFDIIAIAEFGSGTFGKTGTNTVTLFLQRRADNPNMAKHLEYMVNSWFEGDFSTNEHFKDNNLLKHYTQHIEVDLELYKTVLTNTYNKTLFELEMFSEYAQEFLKLSETKKRKKQKYYKALNPKEKEQREQKELLNYVRAIEQDKLYYFCLAYLNKKEVLIIKAPSEGAKNKKFLGYEWSGRKGDEGIKYITSGNTIKLDDEAEALEQILNLSNIQTPLYNPKDKLDENKINSLILKNFSDEIEDIPKELESFVSKARVVDILDFSRKEFTKAFSLSPKRKIDIIGKPEWQVKLGDVVEVLIGGTPSRKNSDYFIGNNLWVSISEMNGQIITKTKENISDEGIKKSNVKLIPKGTTLLSFKLSIGKTAIAGKDLYTNEAIAGLIPKTNNLLDKYLFTLFNGKIIDLEKDGFNTFGKSLNSTFLKDEVKIPLPPLEIQKEIIKKCEKVDDEVAKANEQIEEVKEEIDSLINNISGEKIKLCKIISYSKEKISLENIKSEDYISTDNLLQNRQGIKKYDGIPKVQKVTKYNKENILISNIRPYLKKIWFSDREGGCSNDVLVFQNQKSLEFDSKYLFYILSNDDFFEYIMSQVKGIKMPRGDKYHILQYEIPKIYISTQKQIVQKIQTLEDKISKAKKIVESASNRKEVILKKYLQ